MLYDKDLVVHKLLRWEEYLNNYKLPSWKEIPDIGLYMDQMLALLTQYVGFIPVEDQKDRPVTATTINNYVRLRVMPAPEKRKYYRVHIAYLIMIFTLKQSVSIPSIQKILPLGLSLEEVREFYTNYVERLQYVAQYFIHQTRDSSQGILTGENVEEAAIENLVTQTVLTASFSRILAEKLLHLKGADKEEVLRQEEEKDRLN